MAATVETIQIARAEEVFTYLLDPLHYAAVLHRIVPWKVPATEEVVE